MGFSKIPGNTGMQVHSMELEVVPEVGGFEAQIDVKWAEFPVARTDFVKSHFVDDFFNLIQLMGDECDTPFPVIESSRSGDQLGYSARVGSPHTGMASHQTFSGREVQSIPIVAA